MNPAWAPSRFRYSFFKLIAFFVAPRSRPSERPRLLIFEPDQHAFGLLSSAMFAITTFALFVLSWAGWMFAQGGWLWRIGALAFVLVASSNFSLIVTPLFFVAEWFIEKDVSGTDKGIKLVSAMSLIATGTLSYFTLTRGLPGYFAAIFFIGGVSINVIAAIIVRGILRGPITRLDTLLKEASKFDL